jgi:hypothetical protein
MSSFIRSRNAAVTAVLCAALALPAAAGPRAEGSGIFGLWKRLAAWVEAVLVPGAGRAEKRGPFPDPLGTPTSPGDDCVNDVCTNRGPIADPLG